MFNSDQLNKTQVYWERPTPISWRLSFFAGSRPLENQRFLKNIFSKRISAIVIRRELFVDYELPMRDDYNPFILSILHNNNNDTSNTTTTPSLTHPYPHSTTYTRKRTTGIPPKNCFTSRVPSVSPLKNIKPRLFRS